MDTNCFQIKMELKNWPGLKMMANYVKIKIDPEKPRESRLEVALAYDKKGQIPEAIEVMSGVPLHEHDPLYIMTLTINRMSSDPHEFYEGFANVDE